MLNSRGGSESKGSCYVRLVTWILSPEPTDKYACEICHLEILHM